MHVGGALLAADYAGGLLAAVLERVEAEEGGPGRVAAGRVHPDDSALLPGPVERRARHPSRSRAARAFFRASSGVESTHVMWPILRPGRALLLP